MSERKVLSKYYPPDFDPSALARRVKKPKKGQQSGPAVQVVRLMAPMSMRCTRCGEYIYKGRKFNARKETPLDEKYLGIQIYRFYIRCTRCSGEIIFKTDPKNQDYSLVSGAKRNVEAWRHATQEEQEETDEQRLDRLEAEEAEANGEAAAEQNRMEELEAKTLEAKREMEVADALDEIRTRNARIARADHRDHLETVALQARPADEEERQRQQDLEDAAAARAAFAAAAEGVEAENEEEEMEKNDDSDDSDTQPAWVSKTSSTKPKTTTLDAAAAAAAAVQHQSQQHRLLWLQRRSRWCRASSGRLRKRRTTHRFWVSRRSRHWCERRVLGLAQDMAFMASRIMV
ncbi:mRNA splicing protein Yju2 [Sporothrix schenckii 1099-18]|uniref:Splicing factor YJU2 n=1 Tax=Sporothrix schenckii 1099-18 TaxID=1397361 RepID=A0A0F2LXQ8_SPOSC|nr:mRNA splicing protein Yju2 [Sporothrix schenckii 1099-18]KJR80681.1 mRNA splicing protein Yju2 [Sporothrix schenckii 1099-18]